jgi:hypothetical protein
MAVWSEADLLVTGTAGTARTTKTKESPCVLPSLVVCTGYRQLANANHLIPPTS